MWLKNKEIHYAWFVCAGCTLLLFCTGGLSLTGFAAYLPYLTSLKGLAQVQISSIVFVRSLFGVLGMLLVNTLLGRFEIRRLVTTAMAGCAASFVLFGMSDSFAGYLIAAVAAGFSYGLGSMIAVSILISRWFNEHRGLALGICMASTGVSAFIASPAITAMVEHLSLEFSLYAEAVFVAAAGVAVWCLIRSMPSCLNMKPLGVSEGSSATAAYANHTAAKPLFLTMAFGLLLLGASANNISNHLSVLYQSVGFDSHQISTVISLFGISLAFGKFAYGELSDRIGVFRACLVLFIVSLVGSGLCCLGGSGGFALACMAALLVGFGMALASVATSTYAVEVASEQDYPKVVSCFQTTQTFGGLMFATVPGFLADRTGDYIVAYVIMFVLILLSAVVLQASYTFIKIRDKKTMETVMN